MLQLYQSLPEKVITDFFLIKCYKGRPIEYSYKISFQNDEPVLYRTTFCKISNYPQMDLVVIWFERVRISYSHKNKATLESTLNTELMKVSDWLIVNKLSLNVSKSNVLRTRSNQTTHFIIILTSRY